MGASLVLNRTLPSLLLGLLVSQLEGEDASRVARPPLVSPYRCVSSDGRWGWRPRLLLSEDSLKTGWSLAIVAVFSLTVKVDGEGGR